MVAIFFKFAEQIKDTPKPSEGFIEDFHPNCRFCFTQPSEGWFKVENFLELSEGFNVNPCLNHQFNFIQPSEGLAMMKVPVIGKIILYIFISLSILFAQEISKVDSKTFQEYESINDSKDSYEKILQLEDIMNKLSNTDVVGNVQYSVAKTYEDLGDLDKAIEKYKTIINLKDDKRYENLCDDALFATARVHEKQGKIAEAENVYNYLTENFPPYIIVNAQMKKYKLHMKQEDYEKAINDLDFIISKQDNCSKYHSGTHYALFRKGLIYEKLAEINQDNTFLDEAKKSYQRIVNEYAKWVYEEPAREKIIKLKNICY